MNTVLILAYECAPHNRPGSIMGAQRPFQFAKHLSTFGWRTIVLCSEFSTRYSMAPPNWKTEIERIIVGEIDHLAQNKSRVIALPSLRYADWMDNLWLKTVVIDHKLGTISSKKGFITGLSRKLFTFFKLFRGDHSQSWQMVAEYAAKTLLDQNIKIDFIIAEHGPDAGLFAASRMHRKLNIPWIVDFRDPILHPTSRVLRPIVKLFIRSKIRSSLGIINVTKNWARLDGIDFKKNAYYIPNGFDEDEYNNIILPRESKKDKLILASYGNISFPSDLQFFFEVLTEWNTNNTAIDWEFQYYGKLTTHFHHLSNIFKLQDRVKVYPDTSREDLFRRLAVVDAILLFSLDPIKNKDSYLSKGYLPGKVFELMGLKKPFIVIPGDKGELDELALKTKIGFVAKDKNELISILQRFISMKAEKGVVDVTPDEDFMSSYTRRNTSAQIAMLMTELLETQKK